MADLREEHGFSKLMIELTVFINTENVTSLVDEPVGGRNQDLQRPLRSQDDADGEAKQMFVGVIQPHAHHIVLSPRGDKKLFAHGKVLEEDSCRTHIMNISRKNNKTMFEK